ERAARLLPPSHMCLDGVKEIEDLRSLRNVGGVQIPDGGGQRRGAETPSQDGNEVFVGAPSRPELEQDIVRARDARSDQGDEYARVDDLLPKLLPRFVAAGKAVAIDGRTADSRRTQSERKANQLGQGTGELDISRRMADEDDNASCHRSGFYLRRLFADDLSRDA